MTKMPVAVLGIDLGKNSCSVTGQDASGAVVLRRRMTRERLIAFVSELPRCVVAMEACCGAHFLGRLFQGQGHEVRLMSPEYVQPYVRCLIPGFDGALFTVSWKEALWARYSMGAPRRLRQSVERYSIVKRA